MCKAEKVKCPIQYQCPFYKNTNCMRYQLMSPTSRERPAWGSYLMCGEYRREVAK